MVALLSFCLLSTTVLLLFLIILNGFQVSLFTSL